jgi:hypothetical protein
MAPHCAARVELYRADQYGEAQAGAYAYQGESKPFELTHLPVGDYVLVFNTRDQADPDGPFPRTFYPGAPDRSGAQIIHLEDDQQTMNADIHLRRVSMPTRKVTHLPALGWRQAAGLLHARGNCRDQRGRASLSI